MENNRRLELLTSFCGYGNPDTAKIFFMGIEENRELTDETIDEILEGADNAPWPKPVSGGSAQGITERAQCAIYCRLYGEVSPSEIFSSKIHCFNFFPVGAKSLKRYPAQYAELFGRSFKTKSDLYDYFENQSERKQILRSFIDNYIIEKGNLLVVFGKSLWPKIEGLFSDSEFPNSFDKWTTKKSGKPLMIKWSENKQIWLVGHPSHGWINGEVIEKIAEIRKG
jgi:hypothetical protein